VNVFPAHFRALAETTATEVCARKPAMPAAAKNLLEKLAELPGIGFGISAATGLAECVRLWWRRIYRSRCPAVQ